MEGGGGTIGHRKHRQAFKPGGAAAKGGPKSRWQKFQQALSANAPKPKRPAPTMFASVAELFRKK